MQTKNKTQFAAPGTRRQNLCQVKVSVNFDLDEKKVTDQEVTQVLKFVTHDKLLKYRFRNPGCGIELKAVEIHTNEETRGIKISLDYDLRSSGLSKGEIAQVRHQLQMKKNVAVRTRNYARAIKEQPQERTYTPEHIMAVLQYKGYEVDEENRSIVENFCLYFSNVDQDRIDQQKGLLLFGSVGVGKTYLFQKLKRNPIRTYDILRCDDLIEAYNITGDKALVGLDQGCICFDDLGSEELGRYYGNEVNIMKKIIEKRYRTLPHYMTHFTSNLTAQQIEDYYGLRTRDRLREMCNPLAYPVNAKSRRK